METNTGMQRATSLTVVKTVGGVQIYSRIYNLLSSFSTYVAITANDCARLSVADYTDRLTAFKTYVESIEIGLTVNTASAYVENTTACPI
nr:hypothetical protein [uncultured Bacteroides sp.]